MSAVVKQPETEDRGAVTAWDTGREARQRGGKGRMEGSAGCRGRSFRKVITSAVVSSVVYFFLCFVPEHIHLFDLFGDAVL